MIVPINTKKEKSGMKTICMTHPDQNHQELFLMCYAKDDALQELFEEGYVVSPTQIPIDKWIDYVEYINAKPE